MTRAPKTGYNTPLLSSYNLVCLDRSVQGTYSSILKMKKVRSSETSVFVFQTTGHITFILNIPS